MSSEAPGCVLEYLGSYTHRIAIFCCLGMAESISTASIFRLLKRELSVIGRDSLLHGSPPFA